MDPLAILATAIGIGTVTAQSAMILIKAVKIIKGAQAEIKAISRDVQAFYAVVFSLNTLLKDDEVNNAISRDAAIVEMIENLTNPLQNCQSLLTEIMMKLRKQCKLRGENKHRQIQVTTIKWGLCTKGELKDLQLHLEATKSTLCSALSVISMCVDYPPRRAECLTYCSKTMQRATTSNRQL